MKYLRKLYDWVLAWAEKKHSTYALFILSFIESSFFPIPPDLLLIPMVIAKPKKGLMYASICTIASVIGGVFGYIIGYYLMETLGYIILNFYNAFSYFDSVKALFNEYGIWAVGIAGLTPIPYKVFTIASGVFSFSIFYFVLLSIISRGLRFFILALLLMKFGPKIRIFIEKYFNLLSLVFVVLLILGYVFIHYYI